MNERKKLNPTTFRLTSFIPIVIILIILWIIFKPNFKMIIGGILAGSIISIHDFIIEYYAFKKGLWYCYGGFQKIGKYNLHVPIDMSILFFIGGFDLAIFSTFPTFIRENHLLINPLINNPYLDFIWIILSLIILSLFGAAADFSSKKFGVWENGETWTYWKCVFYAWFPLLCFPVILNYIILFIL